MDRTESTNRRNEGSFGEKIKIPHNGGKEGEGRRFRRKLKWTKPSTVISI